MSFPSENENWLIDTGHIILEKKAAIGYDALSPIEHLIRCWWIADYGMRNGGDLETALDVDSKFLSQGLRQASNLALPLTKGAFEGGKDGLELTFFDRFEEVCRELREAYGK